MGLGPPLAAVALALAIPLGLRASAALRESADREEAAPSAGRFVRAGDVELYLEEFARGRSRGREFASEARSEPASEVTEFGEGPVVLLVSGTGGWSGAWRGTASSLARAGYRAVAVDLPPFGFSERPTSGAYRRIDGARRLIGVLDALGAERAIVVGHSFGAGACVEAALLAPDRLAALVLVDGALGLPPPSWSPGAPPDPSPLAGSWPGAQAVREVLVSATLTNPYATRSGLRLLVADPEDATEAWAALFREPLVVRGTTPAIARWLPELLAPDPAQRSLDRAQVAGLAMPTALLWGSADGITPPSQGRDLAALIPGARLVMLDGLGHIPQVEDSERFDRALIEVLDQLAPQR